MNWKTPLILLVILSLIAGYFFFVEQRGRARKVNEEKNARKVLPYGIDEVVSVRFTNPNGDRIEWKRDGEAWTITHPTLTPGSSSTIDYFMAQMIPGQKRNEFETEGDLTDYGLADPFAIIVFETSERTDTLFVGDSTPLTSQCYVRRNGSTNVMVTRGLTRNLVRKNLYHLRDKAFLHISQDSIIALKVSDGDKSFTFDRHPGTWMIRGTRLGADRTVVEPYLTGITDAIIRDFPAEDLSDMEAWGFGSPHREIILYTDNDSVRIEFGHAGDEFVYVVKDGLAKVLAIKKNFQQVFDWLDERIMVLNVSYFNPDEVRKIQWEMAESSSTIYQDDGVWRSGEDSSLQIAEEKVRYFLILVRGLVFDRLGETGFSSGSGPVPGSTVRLTLYDVDDIVLDSVTISGSDSGKLTAGSISSGSFGTVRDTDFGEIVRFYDRLRTPTAVTD